MTSKERKVSQNESDKETSTQHNVLLAYPWFHGILTKDQVEKLMIPRRDGDYLVRESTSCPGTYILAVCYKQELVKFVIDKRNGGFVIIHASKKVYPKVFNTIPNIIEHFQNERSGMPTRLVKPVERKVLGFGVWEYQQSDDHWRVYSGKVNSIIEQAILDNKSAVKVQISGNNYTLRLDTRTQHNHQSGTWKKIRRRQVTTTYDDMSIATDSMVSPGMTRSQSTIQNRKTGAQDVSRVASPGLGPRSKSFREMPKSSSALNTRSRSFHTSKSAYSSPHRTLARSTSPPPSNQHNTLLQRPTSPSYPQMGQRAAISPAGDIHPEVYKTAPKSSKARPGSPVPMTRSSSRSPPGQLRDPDGLIKSRRPVLPRPHLAPKTTPVDDESMKSNSTSAFDADDESDSDEEHLLTSHVRKVSFNDSPNGAETKPSDIRVRFPSYWSHPDDSGKRPSLKLVPLLSSSMEYNRILNALLKSMPVVVQRIARVENIDLWQAYFRKREMMHRRCKQGEQVYECSLFHGTRFEYVGSICKQNFDFRLSGGQHGTAFGYGNYFAVSAARASSYSAKDEDGNKHTFVCKVLVGDYTKGNPTLRRPPPKFSTSNCYEMYDSVCDNVREPSVFVVFDNDQSYPDYIITYR